AADGGELGRREALVAEVAVHVGRGCVAGLTGVHDDDRAALPPELEGGAEAGGGAADDRDVAVALDGVGGVVAHGSDDTVFADDCNCSCTICKTVRSAE